MWDTFTCVCVSVWSGKFAKCVRVEIHVVCVCVCQKCAEDWLAVGICVFVFKYLYFYLYLNCV